MCTLKIEFTRKKYAATPWNASRSACNVEWPPSPLRILRMLCAQMHKRGDDPKQSSLIDLLKDAEFSYDIPDASKTYAYSTYKPTLSYGSCSGRKIYKVVEEPLYINLRTQNPFTDDELSELKSLCSSVHYLGESMSLCEIEVLASHEHPVGYGECVALDDNADLDQYDHVINLPCPLQEASVSDFDVIDSQHVKYRMRPYGVNMPAKSQNDKTTQAIGHNDCARVTLEKRKHLQAEDVVALGGLVHRAVTKLCSSLRDCDCIPNVNDGTVMVVRRSGTFSQEEEQALYGFNFVGGWLHKYVFRSRVIHVSIGKMGDVASKTWKSKTPYILKWTPNGSSGRSPENQVIKELTAQTGITPTQVTCTPTEHKLWPFHKRLDCYKRDMSPLNNQRHTQFDVVVQFDRPVIVTSIGTERQFGAGQLYSE